MTCYAVTTQFKPLPDIVLTKLAVMVCLQPQTLCLACTKKCGKHPPLHSNPHTLVATADNGSAYRMDMYCCAPNTLAWAQCCITLELPVAQGAWLAVRHDLSWVGPCLGLQVRWALLHGCPSHKDDKLLPEPGTKQPGLLATAYGSCAF